MKITAVRTQFKKRINLQIPLNIFWCLPFLESLIHYKNIINRFKKQKCHLPILSKKLNIYLTGTLFIFLLGLAKRVNAKILIASTSEVYGDPEVHPQSETYWGHVNPIGPRACYDEG